MFRWSLIKPTSKQNESEKKQTKGNKLSPWVKRQQIDNEDGEKETFQAFRGRRRSLSCPITVCKIRNDFPPVVQADDRQEMWTYLQVDARNRFSWPLLMRQRRRSRHRAVIIECAFICSPGKCLIHFDWFTTARMSQAGANVTHSKMFSWSHN